MYTIELRKGVSATLPFEDKRDFDEAKKGFIAEPPFLKIMADAGNVAWDMASYQWLLQGKDFQSIHPSLQRQAVLNMAYGLYEVAAGQDLPGARLRPGQHQLHQGRYRLDRLRSADGQGNRPGGARIHQREARQAAGAGRRLLALARRPLRRRARRGGRGRRGQRQGQGDRAGGLHAGGDRGERVLRQRDVAPHPVLVRRPAAARPVRSRGPVDRQERGQRQRRADRAEPADQRRTSRK